MKKPNLPVIVALTAVVAALVGAMATAVLMSSTQPGRSPSCTALPVRFILQDPECAQRLLDAMNVSHLQIERPNRFFNSSNFRAVAAIRNGTPARNDSGPTWPGEPRSKPRPGESESFINLSGLPLCNPHTNSTYVLTWASRLFLRELAPGSPEDTFARDRT
jgi:hypothetical protein